MSETKETEPLAKTRTRRSNAGARMHQMIFNAEDDEQLARVYGIIKDDDDSSEDEEYVPKDLELNDGDVGIDDDNGDDGSCSSSSDEDDDDDDDDDDDEDDSDDSEGDEGEDNDANEDNKSRVRIKSENSRQDVDSSHVKVKQENGKQEHCFAPGSPTKSAYNSCARICSVCLGDQSDEDDEIIECDSCGVTVHEACYGVSSEDLQEEHEEEISLHSNISSESTEPWFCEPCRRSVKSPYCELCPNTGGIFKETDTGKWVHMVCALYTRGVTFENVDKLSEVSLFELNYALYGSKICTICEDRRLARTGICIECDAGLCKTFFHPTCAQKEGLLFESHSDEVDPYFAQCKQHADKSIIRKKKRTATALYARLKRVQPLQTRSDRVKRKLEEITKQPNPHYIKWTPEHRPPIPMKVSRMLMTSPSLIIKLNKKSELLGLDPESAFMTVQDEMETAKQKWHIPPAFNLEFVAYCHDRTTRMVQMKKKNVELMNQNTTLKIEEASLREKYNSIKEVVSKVRAENDALIREARAIQKSETVASGKQYNLPHQMEQLIARCSNIMSKSPTKSSSNKTATKTSATYGCGKCGTVKDQHLLALCDTCKSYLHIYCLDPPLSRVPKKTKFGGWQCSDCAERDEEEQEEAIEEQNALAIQEADGPRKLRERIKYPDKYCHESMMMADFWSLSKKRLKKGSKSSKSKRPKVKVEI